MDAYIKKSAPFAQEILEHIRGVVHAACPDATETMKWGMPHFEHKGIMCGMAAFKEHCTFGFWKSALVLGRTDPAMESAMGQFGRITRIADLPPKKVLAAYVKTAARLNGDGEKAPRVRRTKGALIIPDDLTAALVKNKAAKARFDAFTPGRQREYVEWIEGAKTDATRQRRIATTVEWSAEGKALNWKYESC